MSRIRSSTWPIQQHTLAKHAILKGHLDAWFPIMSSSWPRVVYIDGFAGPGRYSGGEDGSPIIALKAAAHRQVPLKGQAAFLFIELDGPRKENLEQEIQHLQLPQNIPTKVHQGKFDETVSKLLDDLDASGGRLAPTFAFVDPFGWSQTPMSIITRLLGNPHCEVLVNFMFEEVNRFLAHPGQGHNLDELFGTSDWRDILRVSDPGHRHRAIHDLYAHQLGQSARFVRSFEMRNSRNVIDYFLFFATNHAKGLEKMKEAMWRTDPVGGGRFSDATNPNQLVLFGPEPSFATLRGEMEAKFAGQTVGVEEVERFVVEDTAFLASHYKTRVLAVMEREQPPAISAEGKPGRRAGTFPKGTRITFEPLARVVG